MTNPVPRIPPPLRGLAAALTVIISGLAICAPADAAHIRRHAPRLLGVIHHNLKHGARRSRARVSSAGYVGSHNLVWHGGAVMHANHVHLIFWAPTDTRALPRSYAFAANYKSLITSYLANVAHDSGSRNNVFSTDAQYTDGGGGADYSSTFSPTTDVATVTDNLPAQLCTPAGSSSACLTDLQQEQEVSQIQAAHGWSTGLGDIYFIVTPPAIDTCQDTGAPSSTNSCSSNSYCAYHSYFQDSGGHEILYATQPYPTSGCDTGQRPNGSGAGSDPYADYAINTMSHEQNETITDPDGLGWYVDNTGTSDDGNENGDQCNFTFGSPSGGASGAQWNQTINGAHYWLQGEWSNVDSGCAYSLDLPPTITSLTAGPQHASPGQAVSLAVAASDADGTVTGYTWSFGDGSPLVSGVAATTSHAYGAAGTYTVTVTALDNAGRSARAATTVAIDPPPAPVTLAPPVPPPPVNPIPPRRDSSTLVTSLRLTSSVFPSGRRPSPRQRVVYTLAEAGTTTVYLDRRSVGQRRGGRCVAAAAKRRPRVNTCTLSVRVSGALRRHDSAGANAILLAAVVGRRSLAPAAYSLTVAFRGDDGVATSHSVALRVR